jgi:DNA-binding transcriptional ArsR family regulator
MSDTHTDATLEAAIKLDEGMPDEEILYDLADLFKVFSDTTRIKILYSLMPGELRVADIADTIGATQSAVSHQLRILKAARLVKFQRDGKNVLYSLADDHVYTMLAQGMSHICE